MVYFSGDIVALERETLETLTLAKEALERRAEFASNSHDAILRALSRAQAISRRPARFALAGEFNSGKSTLCNRLVGVETLPTDIFATTHLTTRLHFAETPMISARTRSGAIISLDSAADEVIKQLAEVRIGLPDKFLGEVELLDLPGLADPVRADSNEFATTRVDAIVWCTPCTQAWKESERVAWSRLPERLKRNSILVVTFCDLVKNDRERQRVIERLEQISDASFLKIVSTASTPGAVGSGHNLLRQLCLEHAETLKLDRLIRAAQMADRLLQTI